MASAAPNTQHDLVIFDFEDDTTPKMIQNLVLTKADALRTLRIICEGNCADIDLRPLAGLTGLRQLFVEVNLAAEDEATCVTDEVIETWAQAMPHLEGFYINYEPSTNSIGNKPTFASLHVLAKHCPNLTYLTIPIDTITHTNPIPNPITPFANLHTLSTPSFPVWRAELRQWSNLLAATCPSIRRFRAGNRYGRYAQEFTREPHKLLAGQIYSALKRADVFLPNDTQLVATGTLFDVSA